MYIPILPVGRDTFLLLTKNFLRPTDVVFSHVFAVFNYVVLCQRLLMLSILYSGKGFFHDVYGSQFDNH